jgi:hypothetical protein
VVALAGRSAAVIADVHAQLTKSFVSIAAIRCSMSGRRATASCYGATRAKIHEFYGAASSPWSRSGHTTKRSVSHQKYVLWASMHWSGSRRP